MASDPLKFIATARCAEMAAQYRMQAAASRELAAEFDRNAERWESLAASPDLAAQIQARRDAGFLPK